MKFMTRLAKELHAARQREAHVAVRPLPEPKKEAGTWATDYWSPRVQRIWPSPLTTHPELKPETPIHALDIHVTHANPDALTEFQHAITTAIKEYKQELVKNGAIATTSMQDGRLHVQILHRNKKKLNGWRGRITRFLDWKSRPTP